MEPESTQKIAPFAHHVYLGRLDTREDDPDSLLRVFVTIEWTKDGNLSFTGVVGPKSSGDADRCGQIQDSLGEVKYPAEGISKVTLGMLAGVWNRFHLNDMKPNCEHQKGKEWDPSQVLYFDNYKLAPEVSARKVKKRRDVENRLISGESVEYTKEEKLLFSLPYSQKVPLDSFIEHEEYYAKQDTTQEKAASVNPQDHPGGILTKPCHKCGYKWGTAWKREEVPAEVVQWLKDLPQTDKLPKIWR